MCWGLHEIITVHYCTIMKRFSLFVSVILLTLTLPFQLIADDYLRGDTDLDGKVNIADVTTLIDYLLTGSWNDEPTGPSDGDVVTYYMNGIAINMVYVEGGTFWMGASGTDTEANANEYPAHQVTLSPYYICNTEVTQQLWRAVMGSNPSTYTENVLNPVDFVSWVECKNFIKKLNEITGLTFRFLTEAEWEFAARGGNKSKGYIYSGSNNIDEVAWYDGTTQPQYKTRPVATKKPNELGLYDMSGNVSEWVYDGYTAYSSSPQTNPIVEGGTNKVLRGGDKEDDAKKCRVSWRAYHAQSVQYNGYYGLRIAMSAQ